MDGSSSSTSFGEQQRGSRAGEDLALRYSLGDRAEKFAAGHVRGPPTPSMSTPAAEFDQQLTMGSPPPPPTPAASPGPSNSLPDWRSGSDDDDEEDLWLAKVRGQFKRCSGPSRTRILADLLSQCTPQQLSFVHQFVSPLLKKDPFMTLPDELCMRVLSFIDDPKVLLRASQVSRRWRDLLSDEMTWKNLCDKHDYCGDMPEIMTFSPEPPSPWRQIEDSHESADPDRLGGVSLLGSNHPSGSVSFEDISRPSRRQKVRSYKSHFKQKYLVEAAWRTGGTSVSRNITQEVGVVTSLHLTPKYIVVALDNARIHIFDRDGDDQRMLQGHVMGVWAMVPWEDMLVSGGCDRDVRVWDLATANCLHTLRGHTSTVRCLKMSDANTAISGSRDTTLRVWDIRTGLCRNVLVGHQASVRCLEIKGDIVVSGSYDTTAKVWSISEGRCIQTLQGHFSQIYAVAFDGKRVVTGSLDTNVRVWDPRTGECLSTLQGHTSLVGQLQMRGDTLVTGGSDGSVRVWSLEKGCAIHRLAAHDNSVTTLQFDDSRVVSGGSDGRVKIWDLKTGHLVRELASQFQAVWRVAFEEEKCVVLAQKQDRTVMEVWSFSAPPDDTDYLIPSLESHSIEGVLQRPMSAPAADYLLSQAPQGEEDTEMSEAGPSTSLVSASSLQPNAPSFRPSWVGENGTGASLHRQDSS